MLRYLSISIASLFAGAIAGAIGGLLVGWLLARSYHLQGPSDPRDAPVYVAMGMVAFGACLGAIIGLIVGIVISIRSARRKMLGRST